MSNSLRRRKEELTAANGTFGMLERGHVLDFASQFLLARRTTWNDGIYGIEVNGKSKGLSALFATLVALNHFAVDR